MTDGPIRLAYQQPRPPTDPARHPVPRSRTWQLFAAMVNIAFWMTMAGILIWVPAGAAHAVGGAYLSLPTLVVILTEVPMVGFAVERVRRRRMTAALGYLQQAIRLNVPLNRILAAAVRSESGQLQRRLFILQSSLEAGASIGAAMQMAFGNTARRAAGLIEYAEHIGRVPQTVDRLIREDLGESQQAPENRAIAFWYPPLLLVVANGVIGVISIFASPKLEGIFRDFHLKIPLIARILFGAERWVAAPLLVMVVLIWFAWAMRLREILRPAHATQLFRGPIDRILWAVPIYRGILRERALADLCSAAADATELGFPLEESLGRAQVLELNAVMRRRIGKWNQGMSAGLSSDEAARAARLPQFLVGMLATARMAGDFPEILRFAARFYHDRFVLHREFLREAYLPATTFVMGIVVGGVVLGIFLPIARLVAALPSGPHGGL